MSLKNLFGKLVKNYGDYAAKLVANKGDDIARAVGNYGDDILRVADKVDDFLPTDGVWKRVDDNLDEFVPYSAFDGKMPAPDFPNPEAQALTKSRLKQARWDRKHPQKTPTMDFMGPGRQEYSPTVFGMGEFLGDGWADEIKSPRVDRMVPYYPNSLYTVRTPEIPREWVSQKSRSIYELPNYDPDRHFLVGGGQYAAYDEYAPLEAIAIPEGFGSEYICP